MVNVEQSHQIYARIFGSDFPAVVFDSGEDSNTKLMDLVLYNASSPTDGGTQLSSGVKQSTI